MDNRRFDTLTRRALASGIAAAVLAAALGSGKAAERAERKRRHSRICCPDGSRSKAGRCSGGDPMPCWLAGLCCADGSRAVAGACSSGEPLLCDAVCDAHDGCWVDHTPGCMPGCGEGEAYQPGSGQCLSSDGFLNPYRVCYAVRRRKGKGGKRR